jgi:hypothetical protein
MEGKKEKKGAILWTCMIGIQKFSFIIKCSNGYAPDCLCMLSVRFFFAKYWAWIIERSLNKNYDRISFLNRKQEKGKEGNGRKSCVGWIFIPTVKICHIDWNSDWNIM